MEKPEQNGVCLTFKYTPTPSYSDLIDLHQQQPDLSLRSNSQDIFLPAPCQLNTDSSLIIKKIRNMKFEVIDDFFHLSIPLQVQIKHEIKL
jgi:hypothetical protein